MLTLTAAINNSKLNNFLILDLYYRQLRARIEAINRRENFFFFLCNKLYQSFSTFYKIARWKMYL